MFFVEMLPSDWYIRTVDHQELSSLEVWYVCLTIFLSASQHTFKNTFGGLILLPVMV